MCVRVFGIGMAGVRCVTRHVFARSVPARSPCVTKNSVSWCAAATRCSQYHFSPQAAELPHPHRCCCWPKAKLIAAKLQLTHTAHNTAHCCLAWHADAAAAAADTGRRKKSGRPKTLWVAVDDGLAPLPEGNRGSYNAPSCDRPIGEGVLGAQSGAQCFAVVCAFGGGHHGGERPHFGYFGRAGAGECKHIFKAANTTRGWVYLPTLHNANARVCISTNGRMMQLIGGLNLVRSLFSPKVCCFLYSIHVQK